jgi:hypothetical protein
MVAAPWFGARPLGAVRGVTMGRIFFGERASLALACPHVGVYIDPL